MTSIKKILNGFTPAIVWWAFVLLLMCTPGKDFPKLGSWTELISLDKIIHVCIFALMTFLFIRPLAKKGLPAEHLRAYFLKIALAISIWGLTTEFIQHFWIPGRSFDLWDWVADSFGSFAGLLYAKKRFLGNQPIQ